MTSAAYAKQLEPVRAQQVTITAGPDYIDLVEFACFFDDESDHEEPTQVVPRPLLTGLLREMANVDELAQSGVQACARRVAASGSLPSGTKTLGGFDARFDGEDALFELEDHYEAALAPMERSVVWNHPGAAALPMSPDAREVAGLIDGRRPVCEIVLRCRLPRARALAALCEIHRGGLIVLVP